MVRIYWPMDGCTHEPNGHPKWERETGKAVWLGYDVSQIPKATALKWSRQNLWWACIACSSVGKSFHRLCSNPNTVWGFIPNLFSPTWKVIAKPPAVSPSPYSRIWARVRTTLLKTNNPPAPKSCVGMVWNGNRLVWDTTAPPKPPLSSTLCPPSIIFYHDEDEEEDGAGILRRRCCCFFVLLTDWLT